MNLKVANIPKVILGQYFNPSNKILQRGKQYYFLALLAKLLV